MHLRAFPLLAVIMLAAPSAASAAFSHVVAPGESLSSVAATDGLSVERLAAANGLSSEASLLAGSTLVIPPQTAAGEGSEVQTSAGEGSESGAGEASHGGQTEEAGSEPDGDADDAVAGPEQSAATSEQSAAGSRESGSYVVQPGDTLSAIAARAGTTVEALAAANGVDPTGVLLSGVALRLPGGSPERSSGAEGSPGAEEGRSPGSETAAAAPETAGGAPVPTSETVSPSEVGSIAEEHGVPPSLAEAIAEQESGFNNSLTSSADARGVMQIVPGTWEWINQHMAGSTPLNPESARSNVEGGVLLLRALLNDTEGNSALAAAGYFQGLESVRRHGEIPETEQYVNNILALQSRFGGE
jgi:LysM repeat protein